MPRVKLGVKKAEEVKLVGASQKCKFIGHELIRNPNLKYWFCPTQQVPLWVHLTFAKTSLWGGKIPD